MKLFYEVKSDFLYIQNSYNGTMFYSPIIKRRTLIDSYCWEKMSPVECLITGKTKINCDWFIEDDEIVQIEDYPLESVHTFGDIFGIQLSTNQPLMDHFQIKNDDYMCYIGYILTEKGLENIKTLLKNK